MASRAGSDYTSLWGRALAPAPLWGPPTGPSADDAPDDAPSA